MSEKDTSIELGVNKNDHAAILIKNAIAFAVPVVGALLGDIIANQIPNQRLDRIENYFKIFGEKVEKLEADRQDQLKARLSLPESLPFIEKMLKEAASASTEEKRRYLASALKTGLLSYDQDELLRERLLSLVGQLNELEIMRLFGASLDYNRSRALHDAFWTEEREKIFFFEPAWDDDEEADRKEMISRSYALHLVQLGLLTETNIDSKPTFLGAEVLKFIEILGNLPDDLKI